MAITSARMQMKRGEEAYFDPDKMLQGEWAVSTDKQYVRMCFSPGVCVRMATYEAFEEDMEQIIAILEEAKTVQEAIEKIYEEFQKAELDIEAAENAAVLSESYAHGGTGTRDGEDTDNAKYYAESVSGAVGDIALNRQTLGYVKKNLYDNINNFSPSAYSGVTISRGEDDTFNATGTPTTNINCVQKAFSLPVGKYIVSRKNKSNPALVISLYNQTKAKFLVRGISYVGTSFEVTDENDILDIRLQTDPTYGTANVIGQAIMIRPAEITDPTYEPYVDDVNTRLKALKPVANLVTTVAGKPLDAVIGKELADRVTKLEDAFINYPVSLINGWTGELVVAINVFNRQATITGYINGTNATDVVFAKGRDYVSQLVSTLCDMPVPVQATAITAIDYATAFYRITFSSVDDGWDVKAPNIGKTYQFNASVIVSKN